MFEHVDSYTIANTQRHLTIAHHHNATKGKPVSPADGQWQIPCIREGRDGLCEPWRMTCWQQDGMLFDELGVIEQIETSGPLRGWGHLDSEKVYRIRDVYLVPAGVLEQATKLMGSATPAMA